MVGMVPRQFGDAEYGNRQEEAVRPGRQTTQEVSPRLPMPTEGRRVVTPGGR